jgi:acyl carrier protein
MEMNEKNIKVAVIRLFKKYIDIDMETVSDETLIMDELNISSKQFISFILALQEEFKFIIDENDGIFENMYTIQAIVQYILSISENANKGS